MPPTTSAVAMPSPWTPVAMLRARFSANLAALNSRYPTLAQQLHGLVPARQYFLSARGGTIVLGTRPNDSKDDSDIQMLPVLLPAATASHLARQLFPNGSCQLPVAVAGEDVGWLWNTLYGAPCNVPMVPNHRPALYFLINDLERLWVILHVQEWTALLADSRVRLFAGSDAFDQMRHAMKHELMVPWPKMMLDTGCGVWPKGVTIDHVLKEAQEYREQRLAEFQQEWKQRRGINGGDNEQAGPARLAKRLASGEPLRVLGVTSLYTTFLQHSMRDWLAAFEQLGHQTRLLIETAHHQIPSPLMLPSVCTEFEPDLIVSIDHGRRTLANVPADVPVVMWVQDRMPHIYDLKSGQAQQRLDYTIGYGRSELTQSFGYPGRQFMPAMMAVNESRFSPQPPTPEQRRQYGCEVSFVTNATRPAQQIVRDHIQRVGTPEAKRLFDDIYQQLEAVYAAGNAITSGKRLENVIEAAMSRARVDAIPQQLMHFVQHELNNALFRHQAVRWVAEMGVNLHLYGGGWENNPEFARYARGVADNQKQLPIIYRASAINLQVTPFGGVHQRLLDGLAAGGFFLLRGINEDQAELVLAQLYQWCQRAGVRSGEQMLRQRDDELNALARRYADLVGVDFTSQPDYYLAGAEEVVMSGLTRTPNTLWSDSEQVTFCSRQQLQEQVRHFLAAPQQRSAIASSMRQRVLETLTYQSISRRLLGFIARDVQSFAQPAQKLASAA